MAQESSVNGIVTRGASRRRRTLISKPNFTSAGSTVPVIGAAERIMRRRAQRQMALAAEQAGGRVHADPAGAGQIDLGPGVQVGEILVRALRPFERIDVGLELDEIAGDETGGEAEPAQDLHQQPGRVAAGAGAQAPASRPASCTPGSMRIT